MVALHLLSSYWVQNRIVSCNRDEPTLIHAVNHLLRHQVIVLNFGRALGIWTLSIPLVGVSTLRSSLLYCRALDLIWTLTRTLVFRNSKELLLTLLISVTFSSKLSSIVTHRLLVWHSAEHGHGIGYHSLRAWRCSLKLSKIASPCQLQLRTLSKVLLEGWGQRLIVRSRLHVLLQYRFVYGPFILVHL